VNSENSILAACVNLPGWNDVKWIPREHGYFLVWVVNDNDGCPYLAEYFPPEEEPELHISRKKPMWEIQAFQGVPPGLYRDKITHWATINGPNDHFGGTPVDTTVRITPPK